MIRTALALRVALLRGSLRRGPGGSSRRTAFQVSAGLAGTLSVAGLLGLVALRGSPSADDAVVVLLSTVAAGWVFLPVLTFSSDDLLDASKLALLPLSPREVLTLHGVGALVGIGPAATLLLVSGVVPATAHDLASLVVSVLVVPMFLALVVGSSRTVAALLSRLLRSRRGRDLGVALAALVALGVQLVNPILSRAAQDDGSAAGLHRFAELLSLLPAGLLASAPGRARDGEVGRAVAQLLVVVLLLWLLLVVWERALRRAAETVDRTTASTRRRGGALTGAVDVLAGRGRAGAIATKDLRYLVREPRRLVQLVTAALLPVVIAVGPSLSSRGGLGPGVVFVVCGVALFGGQLGSNRFGLDGTATWSLVAAGAGRRSARADLLGGDIAVVAAVVPLLLVEGGLLAALSDGWHHLPAAVGLALAVLGVTLGTSSLCAVLAPFPVPDGHSNAFSSGGQGAGLRAALLVLASMAVSVVLLLPLLPLLLRALDSGSGVPLLLVGTAYGAALSKVLRELAAREWERRGPEVLLVLSSGRG